MLTATTCPKTCHCGKEFMPWSSTQVVCGQRCAKRGVAVAKKKAKAAALAQKEADKKIPQLIKEAQREFNTFIRLRDQIAGHACISSGLPLDWSGNKVDAGHYRSRGAASWLRFNEDNCHAQRKRENRWLAGNAADYRVGLIARIGIARVEALEHDAGKGHKWTREELISIRDTYRARAKELRKGRES